MKKYIQSSVYVIFVVGTLLVLAKAFTSYENPFSFYENPLVWITLIAFVTVVILKERINIVIKNNAKKAQAEKDGITLDEGSDSSWLVDLMQKLTGSKPMEQEEEIVLDHDYDGIKELDNSLPPWWVYMFYITIIFGVIYLVRFEILDGDSQAVEYEKEVAAAKIAIDKYKETAPDLVDASSVVLLTDEADLNEGKEIYTLNCAMCHLADGGGSIGPNLTDENWILGGGIKNVFATISNGGRDGKGMIAWGKTLKPTEIAKVSSYILSLQGTTPAAPKKAEGEIWNE